LSRER
jgi:AraC-like DNA-binding protein